MNVLIYVCDALRADHLGCYGYARNTTPNIDRFAEDSVRFDNCFAPATWTRPVAASLLTGLYPPAHRARQRDHVLSPNIQRLPQLLGQAGWNTIAVSAMSNVSRATRFDVGFDEFHDLYLEPELISKRRPTDVAGEDFRMDASVSEIALPWGEDVTARFIAWHRQWIKSNAVKPFFALLWTIDTHLPYDCPKQFQLFADPNYQGEVDGSRLSLEHIRSEYDKQHLRDLYDNQVRYSDFNFGVIVDYLKDRNLYDETLVVLLGDHGEAFWEHGQFGHGLLPHDEVLRVPMIIKWPAQARVCLVSDALVNLTDVYSTVLSSAQLSDEEVENRCQSKDLQNLFIDKKNQLHEVVFSETQPTSLHARHVSARTQRWKYIESSNSWANDNANILELWHQFFRRGLWRRVLFRPWAMWRRWYSGEQNRLYDVAADPDEQRNVYRSHPDVVAEFQRMLQEWEKDCQSKALVARSRTITSRLDPETWQQLKALGYVD